MSNTEQKYDMHSALRDIGDGHKVEFRAHGGEWGQLDAASVVLLMRVPHLFVKETLEFRRVEPKFRVNAPVGIPCYQTGAPIPVMSCAAPVALLQYELAQRTLNGGMSSMKTRSVDGKWRIHLEFSMELEEVPRGA